jgi:hypothetical protein
MNNTGGLGAYAEHHFRKVIPGNIETVRQRLCDVLEDFNYSVTNENPLQAKRRSQKNILVANILDYDTHLTIALRSISPASTLATFDYAVQYIFSKGERLTLEREADAIIALVNAPLNKTICVSCETENIGAVRFCRVCGSPMARNKLPAELEVMRLMGDASGTEIEIGWGLMFILFTLMLTLPMVLLGSPKAVVIGWVLFAIGELLGAFFVLCGMRRLHKTLTPVHLSQQGNQPGLPRNISTQESIAFPQEQEQAALPAQPASITEGTTELIDAPQPLPLPAKKARTTDSME